MSDEHSVSEDIAEPIPIAETRELLDILELADVYFISLSGELADNSEDPDLVEGPRLEHDVYSRQSDVAISVRLKTTVESKDALYVVDIVTDYSSEVAFDASTEIRTDFIERVAVMAAWPYLRMAVADLSARMRTEHISLGLLRPGDIALTAGETVPIQGESFAASHKPTAK